MIGTFSDSSIVSMITSPPDIIMDCLRRQHGGNIGIKGYVEALCADQYEEADKRW